LKLPGQGLPSLRGSRRGDIYYQVSVQLPEKVSKDEERLLEEIARIRGWSIKETAGSGIFGRRK
ncbi:MAG: molecular chaperone DnaJ, partial [Bdellovibrionaceae bacterium]|nr:molecular chaperone DnaJ [Pseudobdellovibrionaceae bacterium]